MAKKSIATASMRRRSVESFKGKTANEIAASIRSSGDPLMRTPEWRALRSRAIQTYGAKCMCCGFMPRNPALINVDHIRPRKLFPHLAAEFDNLQILCGRCNRAKGNDHCTDYRKFGAEPDDNPLDEYAESAISQVLRELR